MTYSKPKSPLQNKNEDYFYPLTTSDQIIVEDKRLSDYSILSDNELIITLSKNKWIQVNGQYRQSVTIKDLTEDYNVSAKPAYADDYEKNLLILENATYIKYAKQDDDRITFYCLDSQPQVDIPIELEVHL